MKKFRFVLYEKFSSTQAYSLVSTQFLCALNIFAGGEKQVSKKAMSEFFSNLSMEALNREDDALQLNFRHLRELCDSIKNLLRSDKALMYDKTPDTFNEYSPLEFEEIKDKNRKIEEEVVENMISGRRLSFPRDTSYTSFSITPQEIAEQSRIRDEANRRTSLAMQSLMRNFQQQRVGQRYLMR